MSGRCTTPCACSWTSPLTTGPCSASGSWRQLRACLTSATSLCCTCTRAWVGGGQVGGPGLGGGETCRLLLLAADVPCADTHQSCADTHQSCMHHQRPSQCLPVATLQGRSIKHSRKQGWTKQINRFPHHPIASVGCLIAGASAPAQIAFLAAGLVIAARVGTDPLLQPGGRSVL
jgi:hypothetical protein